MALLLDTHVLAWIGTDDPRLSAAVREALRDPAAEFVVSALIAYEFEDLRIRNRLGDIDTIRVLIDGLNATVLDFPAEACELVPLLPLLHRDPVDRMLVAHAIHADLTLVTADRTLHDYPVRWLW